MIWIAIQPLPLSDSDSSPKNKTLIPAVKNLLAPSQQGRSNILPCSSSNSNNSSFDKLDTVDSVQIQETRRKPKLVPAKGASSKERSTTAKHNESTPVTPRKEKSTDQRSGRVTSLRPKQLSVSGDFKKIRRRTQASDASPKKKWT